MKTKIARQVVVVTLSSLVVAGCSKTPSATRAHTAAKRHTEAAAPAEHHDHEGEDAADSDLDCPLEELFAATCEHGIQTHTCEECRYEVGVVKAPASLFEGGLLAAVKARKQTVAVPLSLTGEVRFDDRRVAHVSTQAEGIIRKVHVTLGDTVKGGQALVEIESVAVGEAEAAYLEAQSMLGLAQRNHDRLAALRREGISSQKEMLQAEQELDAARIRVDAALGKLTRLGMLPSAARALSPSRARARLVLRAPSEGTVLEMHAVAGEIARSDESLATVGDNSALWVWADLYERDVSRVTRVQAKRALAAEIEVKAFAGEPFAGTVDFISPAMSASSRTVKVRIAVANPSHRLLAGMFADVTIYLPAAEQALTVPRCAVLDDEGRSFVFVHHRDDYYVRRPVVTGRSFAGLREIREGLTGDEIVVSEGAFLMKSDVLRSKMGAGCAD